MRKIIFENKLSPGDAVMMTAAIRDLHLSYPNQFITDVRTCCSDIWLNNPYITKLDENDNDVEVIKTGYTNNINQSNQGAYHFVHGYRQDFEEKLNIPIKQTSHFGNIYLSNEEKNKISLVHQYFTGWDTPFWIIISGGKQDYTTKHWIHEYAQEVVDYFYGKIQFVQVGTSNHYHPPLKRVINLIDATNLRELIHLIYHCDGLITPITFAMHCASAIPNKPNKPRHKPTVVTAGGREPNHWIALPNQQFIHTCGIYDCNQHGGCWKARTTKLNDNLKHDNSLCQNTITFNNRQVQKCMYEGVTPLDVIRAIEKYYNGNIIQYLPRSYKMIDAKWDERFMYLEHIIKDKKTYHDLNYARENRMNADLDIIEQIKTNINY